MPTWDQVKSIIERLLLVGLTYAASKGYIGVDDVAVYAPAALAALASVYGAWRSSPKNLVQRTAALPDTTIVTTPSLAHSTPEPNIVSGAVVEVMPKTTADLNREEAARHL